MTPGLFDRPSTPAELAAAERAKLVDEKRKIIEAPPVGGELYEVAILRLIAIRRRVQEIDKAFPPPAPAPLLAAKRRAPASRTKSVRDGRVAAAGRDE